MLALFETLFDIIRLRKGPDAIPYSWILCLLSLVLLWSVPVEGHILARTIDRHWYVGIVVAMAVFIFQFYLMYLLDPTPAVA
jgi:hypothetical protein